MIVGTARNFTPFSELMPGCPMDDLRSLSLAMGSLYWGLQFSGLFQCFPNSDLVLTIHMGRKYANSPPTFLYIR
ncbi:hypothetical protein LINPERHAP1_LOCUS642, partial [Linum perenne]